MRPLREVRRVMLYFAAAAAVIFALSIVILRDNVWVLLPFGVGVLVLIAGWVYKYIYWKCPHCKTYLNARVTDKPKHCAECGRELDWQ